MGRVELDNLVRTRSLKAEPATQAEFDGPVRSGQLRLADALLRVSMVIAEQVNAFGPLAGR